MAGRTRINLNYNLIRFICTTTENYNKYARREANFMRKLMIGGTGKRKWYENKQPISSPLAETKSVSKRVNRRTTVLNQIFMEYITDLMTSSKISDILVGRGIEITHVKVTNDYQYVLVYWHTNLTEIVDETEKILHDYGYKMRHELTQLRVIGQVPLIKFVKNKQVSALALLDESLKKADYGEDHESVFPSAFTPKEQLSLKIKLPLDMKEKIIELEKIYKSEVIEDESIYEVDLPPMRHDVLGLDHHAIMTRVSISMHKSQEATKNRLINMMSFTSNETTPFKPEAFIPLKADSNDFSEFLLKRQEEDRRRMRREKRNSTSTYKMREDEVEDFPNDEFSYVDDEPDLDTLEDFNLEPLK